MSTKVQPISMEDTIQTTITATSSVSSVASPKVSLFAKKSGFVIPKNKLSGSLVPIFRGSKKPGGADVEDEESTKQVLRKTKWAPDLTQDAFVKKGRASAYQTRLEQITQQLRSGIMETRDDQDSSNHQNIEKSELLELERREVIGEILKLNPSYKAPADYKPLLKEDKVVIPIKEHPERNFIELLFAGDTIKRLEKETGAKIRVYGTKADTKNESEITSYDENEANYEDLFVIVTSETYEKVDAAVSLIELLFTPVTANTEPVSTEVPVSEDENPTAVNLTQPRTISPVHQPPPLPQFHQYPNQWQSAHFTPPFPNLSVSTPPSSGPMPIQPPVPLHRPRMVQVPNMGYAGGPPPRSPLTPVQGAPRQQNYSAPNIRPMGSPIPRPNWSQPPPNIPQMTQQMVRPPPPPPPVRSLPPPPMTALRPQPPISNDFTFQAHRPPPPSSQPLQRPGSQFMPPPQPPSFRPPPGPPPMMQQGFRMQQNSHHMGPSSMAAPPDRRPIFPGHGPPPPPPDARQFGPPRPGNFGQNHHPSVGFRPQNFMHQNQQLHGNVPYFSGRPPVPRQQIYDPFSPSAELRRPGNNQNSRKQESDPEYDDLMASVGVK